MPSEEEQVAAAKEILRDDILKEGLTECYELIQQIILEYIDIKKEYLPVITLWILGTYMHNEFQSFPYLFINAMRGSAKTRLLKLIMTLSKDGEVLASLTESSLFRQHTPVGIDELENIGKKDKSELRELLNTAYKKGLKVKRSRKIKTKDGEDQKIESFDTYRPIIMANIWGMEEVLGDRCINIFLEKSSNKAVTKLMEDFSTFQPILDLKNRLYELFSVVSYSVVTSRNIEQDWHSFIKNKYTLTTLTTQTTPITPLGVIHIRNNTTPLYSQISEIEELFILLDEADIDGRNLELFFPLFIIASKISKDKLIEIITIAKEIVRERKIEEFTESKDVMVYSFISKQEDDKNWKKIKDLVSSFRHHISDTLTEEDVEWINPRWFGKSLRRLCLIGKKRRIGEGIEVMLDIQKAKEKIRIFE